ncbi:hypothetical protein THAOC_29245 [Thalassiosira oceanica]|uniref:Uncharacterized protein n=1 Tax=Thalassiosira oceanica TaxID=159749 RepID=K0RRN4_THAOC|nr:hypothetical protein THAOC_29245 [Thalassiosira oceanica]|eukprot:EJK51571.1 hypothetical protein THAOC_29245 [Thalassiosira oceanica]
MTFSHAGRQDHEQNCMCRLYQDICECFISGSEKNPVDKQRKELTGVREAVAVILPDARPLLGIPFEAAVPPVAEAEALVPPPGFGDGALPAAREDPLAGRQELRLGHRLELEPLRVGRSALLAEALLAPPGLLGRVHVRKVKAPVLPRVRRVPFPLLLDPLPPLLGVRVRHVVLVDVRESRLVADEAAPRDEDRERHGRQEVAAGIRPGRPARGAGLEARVLGLPRAAARPPEQQLRSYEP